MDYEPRAADQVPLLISMQEDDLSLVKAIESGDTDLGWWTEVIDLDVHYANSTVHSLSGDLPSKAEIAIGRIL